MSDLPKYERPEGAFAPSISFAPQTGTTAERLLRDVTAPAIAQDREDLSDRLHLTGRHKLVDLPGYPHTSAVIERELVELRQRNADLQASNNKLLDRARLAEERVRQLESA